MTQHRIHILCEAGLIAAALMLPWSVASAQDWAAPGSRSLRSDVELLAARGLIANLTMTWPIPAGQLRELRDNPALIIQPEAVQRAAQRVLAQFFGNDGAVVGVVDARLINAPNVIRNFDASARDQADVSFGLDWHNETFATSLRVGTQTGFNRDRAVASLDGTSLRAVLGNVLIYGGWVDQWYGAGWDSSLILSTNARPFPKIGLMRNSPDAFETPWLSWIGPWQTNFFVGLLNGPPIAENTALCSLRISFAPLSGLEVALMRAIEFCGQGHPCRPLNAAFHLRNDANSPNETNDQASIEFKGTVNAGELSISPYVQFMNEDTGPFTHSVTSYLGGTSVAGGYGDDGAHWRIIAEVSDTVPTLNWFDFGNVVHGSAYNNTDYKDGYRYRGRTLGFSLDSDSRLLSLIGQYTDGTGRSYHAIYRHASISSGPLATQQAAGGAYNVVSSQPVTLDQLEFGLSIPARWVTVDFTLRAQRGAPVSADAFDDHIGAELGLTYRF